MIDHPVDHTLPMWGAWARSQNSVRLNYSQVQYAEFIARASSASDYASVDPDVIRLDRLINTAIEPQARRMIAFRWRDRMADYRAAKIIGVQRQTYSNMLHRSVLPQLRYAWDIDAGH